MNYVRAQSTSPQETASSALPPLGVRFVLGPQVAERLIYGVEERRGGGRDDCELLRTRTNRSGVAPRPRGAYTAARRVRRVRETLGEKKYYFLAKILSNS